MAYQFHTWHTSPIHQGKDILNLERCLGYLGHCGPKCEGCRLSIISFGAILDILVEWQYLFNRAVFMISSAARRGRRPPRAAKRPRTAKGRRGWLSQITFGYECGHFGCRRAEVQSFSMLLLGWDCQTVRLFLWYSAGSVLLENTILSCNLCMIWCLWYCFFCILIQLFRRHYLSVAVIILYSVTEIFLALITCIWIIKGPWLTLCLPWPHHMCTWRMRQHRSNSQPKTHRCFRWFI